MRYLWVVILLLLAGCTKSGVEKTYDMRAYASGTNSVVVVFTQLEATSDTTTDAGDAGISPQTSASVYGPSQVDGVMDDLKNIIEKWVDTSKKNSDNPVTTTTNNTTTTPPTPPVTPAPPVTEDPAAPAPVAGWKVFTEAACDDTMSYSHNGAPSVRQDKCLFKSFATCSELPGSFLVVWEDSSGGREQLTVPNRCNMSWDTSDFRKYRPTDDKYPNPVAYAPRGMEAVKAIIYERE